MTVKRYSPPLSDTFLRIIRYFPSDYPSLGRATSQTLRILYTWKARKREPRKKPFSRYPNPSASDAGMPSGFPSMTFRPSSATASISAIATNTFNSFSPDRSILDQWASAIIALSDNLLPPMTPIVGRSIWVARTMIGFRHFLRIGREERGLGFLSRVDFKSFRHEHTRRNHGRFLRRDRTSLPYRWLSIRDNCCRRSGSQRIQRLSSSPFGFSYYWVQETTWT